MSSHRRTAACRVATTTLLPARRTVPHALACAAREVVSPSPSYPASCAPPTYHAHPQPHSRLQRGQGKRAERAPCGRWPTGWPRRCCGRLWSRAMESPAGRTPRACEEGRSYQLTHGELRRTTPRGLAQTHLRGTPNGIPSHSPVSECAVRGGGLNVPAARHTKGAVHCEGLAVPQGVRAYRHVNPKRPYQHVVQCPARDA